MRQFCNQTPHISNGAVYSIPCNNCDQVYIGQIVDLKRRLYQHKYDLKVERKESSLYLHQISNDHLVNPGSTVALGNFNRTSTRKLAESVAIQNSNNWNCQKPNIEFDILLNNNIKKVPLFNNLISNKRPP